MPRHKGEKGEKLHHLKEHQFKKGVNNYGDVKHADPLKPALRKFNKKLFNKILVMVLTATEADLRKVAKNKDASALRRGIARAMRQASKDGNWFILERIVERITGKIPMPIDHSNKGKAFAMDAGPKVVCYLPSNGRTAEENTDEEDVDDLL